MSIHVSEKQGQCKIKQSPWMKAEKDRWGSCTQEGSHGCNANDPRSNSFGSGFNNNGGGVYAMEWTRDHVRLWFFPRGSIPNGANGPLGSSPKPSAWGIPTTSFEAESCDFDAHIKKQHIIVDTTFCGDWAAGTWESSGCKASTGYSTCQAYVQNKPNDFSRAFWTIRSLKVFN
jgi:hypothetical protein